MNSIEKVNLRSSFYLNAMKLSEELVVSLSGQTEADKYAAAIVKLKSHAGTSCVGTTAVDADALKDVLRSGGEVVNVLGASAREADAARLALALVDMFDPKMSSWAPEVLELRNLWIKFVPVD